jgi:hypothetical protein
VATHGGFGHLQANWNLKEASPDGAVEFFTETIWACHGGGVLGIVLDSFHLERNRHLVAVRPCDRVSLCSAVHAVMVGAHRERMDAVRSCAWFDQFSDLAHSCVHRYCYSDDRDPADPGQITYSEVLEVVQPVVLASSQS